MYSNDQNIFDGPIGGKRYDLFVRLCGYGSDYFKRAALSMPLKPGMKVLDLGCGSGLFTLPVARRILPGGSIIGVDVAKTQLDYARYKVRIDPDLSESIEFLMCSMDKLPYDPAQFDAIVSCMAFHETSAEIRRAAIAQIAKWLKPGGFFGLIDLARPVNIVKKTLALGMFIIGEMTFDNWNNIYPIIAKQHGLHLETDVYLSTLFRCQVFRKPPGS